MTTRPPIAAALLAGLGVLLGLLVSMLAPIALYVIVDRSYGQAPFEYLGLMAGQAIQQWLVVWIVFSLWIAVWFGFIMPVRAELRFGQVLGRSALALLTGAVIASALGWFLGSIGQAAVYTPLGELREDLRALVGVANTLLFNALFLVPLVGMVLWAWLRRPVAAPAPASVPTQEVSA